jgi:hypothetical protein
MMTTIKHLIKFGEEDNIIKLFEKGEIYMNTIQNFKQSDRKEIGDKYEGTVDIKNFPKGELTLYLPDNPIILKTSKLQLLENYNNHLGNIFCSYALSDNLLHRKPLHKIDSRMKNFGSHCIIIKDVSRFLNAIFSELKNRNISYSHNIVKYHNYAKNSHQLTLFNKPHNYAYQKEHRIIAYTDSDEPLKFEIGSIKEYAEIYQTNFLIKNLRFATKNYIT